MWCTCCVVYVSEHYSRTTYRLREAMKLDKLMTPDMKKKMFASLNDCFPISIKGIFVLNQPWYGTARKKPRT